MCKTKCLLVFLLVTGIFMQLAYTVCINLQQDGLKIHEMAYYLQEYCMVTEINKIPECKARLKPGLNDWIDLCPAAEAVCKKAGFDALYEIASEFTAKYGWPELLLDLLRKLIAIIFGVTLLIFIVKLKQGQKLP